MKDHNKFFQLKTLKNKDISYGNTKIKNEELKDSAISEYCESVPVHVYSQCVLVRNCEVDQQWLRK